MRFDIGKHMLSKLRLLFPELAISVLDPYKPKFQSCWKCRLRQNNRIAGDRPRFCAASETGSSALPQTILSEFIVTMAARQAGMMRFLSEAAPSEKDACGSDVGTVYAGARASGKRWTSINNPPSTGASHDGWRRFLWAEDYGALVYGTQKTRLGRLLALPAFWCPILF